MPVALITHNDCLLHDMGFYHPEQPARLHSIQDRLIASGLEFVLQYHDAPLATYEQLVRVHDAGYVDSVFDCDPDEDLVWLDGDTAMSRHTLKAALRAAGAGVLGVDLVMQGKASAAFCSVRPPGHHAERALAMGFCIFNNIAVAAAHAMAEHGLSRIAIVDFDVHHGNGTEDIFRDEPRVLFCSTFQHPFYPGVGADTKSDHIINVPLPAGTDGKGFRAAVERDWLPALEQFAPQLVMISAGFDAHVADDMAGLALVEPDYAWVTSKMLDVANRHADGRIVSMLEGGYDLPALARSVHAHVNVLVS